MKKLTLYSLLIFTGVALSIFLVGGTKASSPITTSLPSSQAGPTTTSAPGQSASTSVSGLTMSEVVTHNTPDNCYLVINQKVYDVSSYLGQHPGGRSSITSRCGQEVTGIFASIHSNFAWDLLANYYVDNIATSSTSSSSSTIPTPSTNKPQALDSLKTSLQNQLPQASIISIRPSRDGYIALVTDQGILKEVHLDSQGTIVSTEVDNDEYNWDNWSEDGDDH